MKRGTESPSVAAAFYNTVQCTRHSRRTDCLLCHSTLKSFTCVLAHFIQLFYCGAEQWFLRTDNSFSMFNRKLFWLSKAAAKQEELEGQNLRFLTLSKTGRFLFVSLSYGCDFGALDLRGLFEASNGLPKLAKKCHGFLELRSLASGSYQVQRLQHNQMHRADAANTCPAIAM